MKKKRIRRTKKEEVYAYLKTIAVDGVVTLGKDVYDNMPFSQKGFRDNVNRLETDKRVKTKYKMIGYRNHKLVIINEKD